MANVLGLSFFFHDSAAALVSDGKIIAAAAEERFSRKKHSADFPKQAIEYCLEAGGFQSINDVDAIIFYEKPAVKMLRQIESVTETWPKSLFSFAKQFPNFLKNKLDVRDVIANELPGYQNDVLFSQHHLSHAASAFYCSPYRDAAILTIDGVGEWETTTIGVGRDEKVEILKSLHFPHSIGLLYAALTSYLGFKVNDGEWKVMGLAPYGKARYVEQFRELVSRREDGSFVLDMSFFKHHYSAKSPTHDKKWASHFGFERRQPQEALESFHADLAASGQAVVEELILGLAEEAKRITGSENLVIAGGVGLNGVANSKIEREGIFKNVWINPAPGDDGAALGAALLAAYSVYGDERKEDFEHVYLGPEFTDAEIQSFLTAHGIPATKLSEEELMDQTTEMIMQGQVIGWFQGRMEFGPRSLGSRSILADARNPLMKNIINEKIKYRESFRPFAPVTSVEDAETYFELQPGADYSFMIKVVPVRPTKKALLPAITHEDGSARLQTVTRNTNPLLHKLLGVLKQKTGVPVLVNTSFNVRGEPIVCTPQDAYRCFINTGIDALLLGSYLVTEKPDNAIDRKNGYAASDALEKTPGIDFDLTQDSVLNFYKVLPFNYYSNSIDTANELTTQSPLKVYKSLVKHLQALPPTARVLDVGCGAGWFLNACAHFHGLNGVGVDLNPVVLRQARSVARLIPKANRNEFVEKSLFEFEPKAQFDVVNSLGVLHHTPDCYGAIRKALSWVKPGGYLHLGLYHSYGRRPFLKHFEDMQSRGATEKDLFTEFKRLNPEMKDETHLRSWFRDQVLHPHETQHSFEEIYHLLETENFSVESTSINDFAPMPAPSALFKEEKKYESVSRRSLENEGRYFPGFFVVWAKKNVSVKKDHQ